MPRWSGVKDLHLASCPGAAAFVSWILIYLRNHQMEMMGRDWVFLGCFFLHRNWRARLCAGAV